jgi:hypothetical protein
MADRPADLDQRRELFARQLLPLVLKHQLDHRPELLADQAGRREMVVRVRPGRAMTDLHDTHELSTEPQRDD